MEKSKNTTPQVGQIYLNTYSEPFEITGYSEYEKMYWCQNLNTGTRWGTGVGPFERGTYKILKPKKKLVIKELGKQIIDAENYIVCLENEIAELKSKINTAEPQRTQSKDKDTKVQSKKIADLLGLIYSKIPTNVSINNAVDIYNSFMSGSIELFDTEGKKLNPKDYLDKKTGLPIKITQITAWHFIHNPDSRIKIENFRTSHFLNTKFDGNEQKH